MASLLVRSSRRYLFRHPWLAALSVLGVAVGVAVVVAIDLANTSARRAFSLSSEAVAGRATHAVVGSAGGLDEDVYRRLRLETGVRAAAPVVEGYAIAPALDSATVQILGVDPFAEAPFRPFVGTGVGLDIGTFLTRPGAALVPRPTAEANGLAAGDPLPVLVDGALDTLRIVGFVEPGDERTRQALANLVVVDVATAQELFGLSGRLSRIDLLIEDDAEGAARLARIEAALPPGAEVARSESRTAVLAGMTRAFELNLTALSLLALVVGTFLIYNTMTFSVVQRRPLIGQLRALGVTRREIGALVLGEAAAVGAVGTLLGLGLGLLLGTGLVRLVTQTINDLYYVVTVRELAIAPLTVAKGVALGLGATILAAAAPAREATHTVVSTVLRRSTAEDEVRRRVPLLAGLGTLALALGGALLLVPTGAIAVAYTALLAIIVGAALLTPAAVVGAARLARPVMGRAFGVLGRMAARGVVATLSRTAVATAALTVAVAATIGVGVMVESFRTTVEVWLSYALQADVYVQAPSPVFRRNDATLAPEVVERLRNAPGVAAASTVRRAPITVADAEGAPGPAELVAVEPGPRGRATLRFKEGGGDADWAAFARGDAVFVSEPYTFRYGAARGDSVVLATAGGPRAFPVAGVYFDYGSDLGVVTVARAGYDRFFDDPGVSGIALYAESGEDVDALVERLAGVGGAQEIIVRSNRGLRETSLAIFDRTFTVTTVLRLLAVLVAFIGVLSALMALQLERAREFAVLRAGGMTPGQVWRYVTLQTGLMGLIAGVLSLPLGLTLASVLVYVINRRSFGWTLQFDLSPGVLAQAVLLALAAALLAGLYPAWKMASADPAEALREA